MVVSSSGGDVSLLTAMDSPGNSRWGPLNLPQRRLFGTDGIRGRVGDVLTPALATQVGYWAGKTLQAENQKGCVIVGQDSRNSGVLLANAIAGGLTAAGLEVWNLGLCPTPAVAYLAHCMDAVGGVMISASHNPPGDNGIKFFGSDGTKLSKQVQQQIEMLLRNGLTTAEPTADMGYPSPRWNYYYDRPELVECYLTSLYEPLSAQGKMEGLKIVLDLAWGAAVHTAPQVFRKLGAEVLCLHDQPDGDRINVNCGSTHLEPLQAAVQNHHADIGFAFDGDADRVMAVDSQGRVVDGDYILYLWGQLLCQRNQLPDNTIVSTVMANLGFERAWQQQGGTLVRTAVGDQHVHAEMVRRGAILGGEQSGHVLCHHYGVSGDGTLTALHLANLVQQSGGDLAALVDQSFQTYPQVLKNVRVEDAERRQQWHGDDMLQQAIAEAESDMGDDGRVLIRASGTEPVIRVMVEAATGDLVSHWCDRLVNAVSHYAAA